MFQLMKRERSGRSLALLAAAILLLGAPARAQEMARLPEFLVTTPSAYDFNATVSRLKQAIEGENMMVLHEIDPQQMLRMVGMRTGGMRQILFFHPRYMKQIMEANRNAGIVPPLKILAMETPDGRVMVRYHDPVHQFAPYPGLEDLASELQGVMEAVVASVKR